MTRLFLDRLEGEVAIFLTDEAETIILPVKLVTNPREGARYDLEIVPTDTVRDQDIDTDKLH